MSAHSAERPDDFWAAGPGARTQRLYQEISDRALVATGARAVSVGRVDAGRVQGLALAVGPPDVYRRTLAELHRVAPNCHPDRYVLPVALNPRCRAAFAGGAMLVLPFGQIAAGMRHGQALDVFRDVGGFQYTLHAPIRVGGRVVGALDYVFPKRPVARQVAAAEAFVRLTESSVEGALLKIGLDRRLASLREAQARAVASEERVRADVAEMLHGCVQGRLLVAGHQLAEALSLLRTDPERAEALLRTLASDLEHLNERDVRSASHSLHPGVIAAGLRPAITVLAERFSSALYVRTETAPEVGILDDPLENRLSPAVRLAGYRIVEEALANAVKHAGASTANVSLEVAAAGSRPALVLTVADDGCGFEPGVRRAGLGISLAQDRAMQIGGTLTVHSAPGKGTTVTAVLPLGDGQWRPGERTAGASARIATV